jgi:transposase-like protein
MEISDSERARWLVPGLIRGRKSDGRCIYEPAAKRAVIALCKQPDASVALIALINAINTNMLRKWLTPKQYRRPRAKPSAVMLPVKVSSAGEQLMAAVLPPKSSASMSCEIVLARATLRLQLDGPGLRAVIEQLNR